jgi:hypothetical protein
MFGNMTGFSQDRMQRGDVVPRQRLRLPEMQLGGATAAAPNPFEGTPLPRQPVRLPEMQLGGRAQAPRRAQFGGLSDADAIAAARNAAQFGNFGGAQLAAGSRQGTRQFTAAQARQFLERNPNAARATMRSVPASLQSMPRPAAPAMGGMSGQSRMPVSQRTAPLASMPDASNFVSMPRQAAPVMGGMSGQSRMPVSQRTAPLASMPDASNFVSMPRPAAPVMGGMSGQSRPRPVAAPAPVNASFGRSVMPAGLMSGGV